MNISIEDRKVFVALALAVADCLEMPTLPDSLKDSLNEVGSALVDELSPGIAFELRALANACAESEESILRDSERNGRHQAQGSEALAIH